MTEIYNTEQNEDYYGEFIEQLSEENSTISFDASKITPQYHIQQAEVALQNLKSLIKESGWKKFYIIKVEF